MTANMENSILNTSIQGTKKMGCPTHIIVKEYHLYPEYKITETEQKASMNFDN